MGTTKVKELEKKIERLVNEFFEETQMPIDGIRVEPVRAAFFSKDEGIESEVKLYGYTIHVKL